MRRTFLALALAGWLAAPQSASAQSNTTLGVGSGAVAGALVGGPIGAVAGAVIGGVVGSLSERVGRRHLRPGRRHAAIRRAPQRRAEAELPRTTGSVTASRADAARPARAWTDPR